MPQLHLSLSNRVEILVDQLAQVIRNPLSAALKPEIVVVQSQGMSRWLSLSLAERLGICANIHFPFPKAFTFELLAPASAATPVTPESLVWHILKLLPDLAAREEFDDVKRYLGDGKDVRKLFQLAHRIAWVFDQYLVYRPDWILDWEAGRETHWQAILWRQLAPSLNPCHPVRLYRQFLDSASATGGQPGSLPERVCIFGISSLPPAYLELFAAVAKKIDVHFFSLQPTHVSRPKSLRPPKSGNRLLESMGKMGREFLDLLHAAGDCNESADFIEPERHDLLHAIQSDVLNQSEGVRGAKSRTTISSGDDSIQVHSCHGPLRELEILQDHLLDWFEKDPALEPRDILVMSPDMECHAPFVRAVFDSPEDESRRIPYSIADVHGSPGASLVETFLALLKLPGSRLGAATVLSILECPMVRSRFGFEGADLEIVRTWIEGSGIRWGIDSAHRAEFNLPAFEENSWRQGLDRLLLGYAMKSDGNQLFQKCLPHNGIEGSSAANLGHLLEFAEKLFQLVSDLRTDRSVNDWVIRLNQVLDDFFLVDEATEAEAIAWRTSLFQMAARARTAEFNGKIRLDVILEALTGGRDEDRFGAGFLTGGVTFCALKPMRSIPFKIICLLGMNDGAFPRSTGHLGFDLMAASPRPGDRSPRADDRYLFLETILSARQKVYLSYTGQSIRDNRPSPPSVVVAELTDYIEQLFQTENGSSAKAQIERRHRLQGFSEIYFNGQDSKLFSYSTGNSRAGQSARVERQPALFFSKPLAQPPEAWRSVPLAHLVDFFCHPSKFIATRRLGLALPQEKSALSESEPFEISGLDAYKIRQDLLELRMSGADLAAAWEMFQVAGCLPAGATGRAFFRTVCGEVEKFYLALEPFLPLLPEAREEVRRKIGPFELSGVLSGFNHSGLFHHRCADIKPRDRIRLWIQHLARNLTIPSTSVFLGRDEQLTLRPVDRAEERLHELLELYWAGSMTPLKFFPNTSLEFVKAEGKLKNGKGKSDPLAKAKTVWRNTRGAQEGEDPYFDLCFHGADPLDDDFTATARTVFGPMLNAAEIISL